MNSNPSIDLIIDVGANYGEFSMDIGIKNPNIKILAIDPNPNLCKIIKDKISDKNLQNIEIIQLAINTKEGACSFNISDHADSGISSLLPFEQSKIEADSYWNKRSDLNFDRQIEVEVKRLDNLLKNYEINKIKFIKIDAQGVDLNVLESLGKYLEITEAGMLEVSGTLENNLYEGETVDLNKALSTIKTLGFKAYAIKPNDHAANEFNIFFCKESINWKSMEVELNLIGINLYDGKNYWHYPSNKWEPIEQEFINLKNNLKQNTIENQNLINEKIELESTYKLQILKIKTLQKDNDYLHSIFYIKLLGYIKNLLKGA